MDDPGAAVNAHVTTTVAPMSAESRAVQVSLHQVGSAAVLTVSGEVDAVSAPQLQSGIDDALARKPAVLVVDLSAVGFFGSAGLSVLLLALDRLAKDRLRVVASPQVRRPIEVTGLDGMLDLFETLQAALRSGETPRLA
ncbi:STAS domain-containing protein [Nocardia sp. NPDC057030]|uniref:STAS domain-containing protein n=1 Tax=unclassified Nocardia TaxID=2637762 RepID=UPI003645207E